MDSVYFCNEKIGKDVANVLKEDSFRHISYIVRNSDRKGYYLYAEATPEDMKYLEEKLKDMGAEKVEGEEEKKIIASIKAEEENAACGMGTIFG